MEEEEDDTVISGLIRRSEEKEGIKPSDIVDPVIDRLLLNVPSYDTGFEDIVSGYVHTPGDLTNRDYLTGYENPFRYDGKSTSLEDIRSGRQSDFNKTVKGVTRIGSKVGAEVAKLPGYAGGLLAGIAGEIIDSENNSFFETFTNNQWIKAVDSANQWVNSELLPVYVKDSVKNGNLWDYISSIDFWATEGADGIGYMAAMFVPGAIINKFKFGEKAFLGLSNLSGVGEKTDEAINILGKIKLTPNNINIGSTATVNTIVESAAEGKGAGDGYKNGLRSEFEAGIINYDEYQTKLKKAPEIIRNTFLVNNAILLGPNLIMSKMIWGAKGISKPGGFGFMNAGKILESGTKETFLEGVGRKAGNFILGGTREGLWEEGMQSAAEQYFVKNPDNDYLDFIGGGFGRAYLDMLKTTDGQKAMFLGAILGGPMDVFMDNKEFKDEREKVNKLLPALKGLDSFYSLLSSDIYDKETGKVDNMKLTNRLKNLKEISFLSTAFEEASKKGETEVLKHLSTFAAGQLITQFIKSGETGLSVLEEYLNQSTNVQNAEKNGMVLDKNSVKETMDRAKKMQKDYLMFKQFAPVVMKVNNEDATKEMKEMYYDQQVNSYLNQKNMAYFYEDLLAKEVKVKKDMLESLGISTLLQSDDEVLKQLTKKSLPLRTIDRKIKDYEAFLKKHKEEINEFWTDKKHQSNFDSYVEEYKKAKEALAESVAEEADTILKDIENAESVEEVENIKVPSNLSTKAIKNAIKAKIKALKKAGKIKAEETTEESKKKAEEKRKEELEKDGFLQNIMAHLNIGEKFKIPSFFKVHPKFKNAIVTIKKFGKKGVIVVNEDGSTATISLSDMNSKFKNTSIESTEGGSQSLQESSKEPFKDTYFVEKGDSKIITVDEKGNKLSFINQEAVDFERNPRNKIGESKSIEINEGTPTKKKLKPNSPSSKGKFESYSGEKFELNISAKDKEGESAINTPIVSYKVGVSVYGEKLGNFLFSNALTKSFETFEEAEEYANKFIEKDTSTTKSGLSEDQQKAVKMVEDNDFTDKEFLINHLPINIKLADDVVAPIETLPSTKDSKKVFDKSARYLRTAIVKELANGTSIENVQVEIIGQFNGQIKTESNPVPENSLLGLFDIQNKIERLKSKDFYIVNEFGNLINAFDEEFATRDTNKAPGEVYLIIKTANGTKFPLKLNVKKINKTQAEALYELYKYRFEEEKKGKNILIKSLPEEVRESIKTNFAAEISWFKNNKKSLNSLTIKDLVDFVIWDGTKSPKSQIRFYKNLLVMNKEFTKEEFETQEGKDAFMDMVTENKRHHVRFKRSTKRNEGVNSPNLNNRSYVEYLINNKILNTNAVINEPTFQGRTNMYLSNDIKVNGKKSKYNVKNNKKKVKVVNNKVIGTIEQLNKFLPKMFLDVLTLNRSGKFYKNQKGDKHQRISTLKGGKADNNSQVLKNSSKRGNTIDEGMRYFFSTPGLTKSEFRKHSKKVLDKQNELDDSSVVQISDEFFDNLYNIFEDYYELFENKGWTIFANTPTLSGRIMSSTKNKDGLFAGTMDLLARTRNGKWIIIDLKTSTIDRGIMYENKKEDIYNFKKGDLIQQNGYVELFEQSTNKIVDDIYILPILTKPEKNTNGTIYNKVVRAKKNSMLLPVKKKSIFEILKINKPTIPKVSKHSSTPNRTTGKVAPNGVDMAAMLAGTIYEEKAVIPVEEPKKLKTKKKKSGAYVLTDKQSDELVEAFSNSGNYSGAYYDGVNYLITYDSYYVLNNENGEAVTDLKIVNGIIRELNDMPGGNPFSEKKAKNIWNSRKKVVPLQSGKSVTKKESKKVTTKTKESKVTNSGKFKIGKVTNEEASNKIVKIAKGYKEYIKDIGKINAESSNPKDALVSIIELLNDKQISLKSIKVKCGL